ncbi:hypothetical protein AGMMS49940_22430 [Spirochaetia bacterium]|nr:hypothetical protein AGMMS49940_22430 [Spirochaetia bacterium]
MLPEIPPVYPRRDSPDLEIDAPDLFSMKTYPSEETDSINKARETLTYKIDPNGWKEKAALLDDFFVGWWDQGF